MKIVMALPEEEFMTRYERILEYFKPKLARTEMTGKDGEKLFLDVDQAKTIAQIYADAFAARNARRGPDAGAK